MKRYKILLGISTNYGISQLIEKNLTYYNFDVVSISPHDEYNKKFVYPSFISRASVKFRKIFLRDKQAKFKLISEMLKKQVETQLNNDVFDYALFFLANNYSLDFIRYIKPKVKSGGMINYQWDGMQRYPFIYELLPFFDRAYVFNPSDLNDTKYSLLPTTNFYFDYDLTPLNVEYDFYFLGGNIPDRQKDIIRFANYAQNKGWKLDFNIVCSDNPNNYRQLYPTNINLLSQSEAKSYQDNLLAARKAKVLVDFVINSHQGLSLRTFEALGHNKKLITTNKEILKYDFYHPHNIFILDDNVDELEEFLSKPYYVIDPNIKEKYSFGNWIKYVLNIHPHQPISLP